jgi:hypothetical protein
LPAAVSQSKLISEHVVRMWNSQKTQARAKRLPEDTAMAGLGGQALGELFIRPVRRRAQLQHQQPQPDGEDGIREEAAAIGHLMVGPASCPFGVRAGLNVATACIAATPCLLKPPLPVATTTTVQGSGRRKK